MRKADGTVVELTLRGDEHFSFYNGNDGQFYVRRSNKLIPISAEEIDSQWTSLKQANENKSARRKKPARRKATEFKGKKKGVVILIYFSDQNFSVSDPQSLYKRIFNEIGYTDNGMSGSVRDYFLEQSYGNLDIEFDVAGPYKAEYSMSYYGAPNGSSNDTRPWEIVIEGCKQADKELNFADYDWDGDGEVDQVFVVYAGYGQNYGASAYTIWPHEYFLGARNLQFKLDGKLINTYACSCELYGNEQTEGKIIDGIGPACHEFSHCLGLRDMYNTSGGGADAMLNWDVMAQGSYNNDGRTPAGFTAYERMFAGWLTPKEINQRTTVTGMAPLSTKPEAYILYNDNHKDEYYLLENRQLVGFDSALDGHGLIITHIDYSEEVWASNGVNASNTHPRCAVVPADGRSYFSVTSLAGDPFPGTMGVTEFSKYTQPAMTLFNEAEDGTYFLSKPLDNIKEDGQLISFIACRPEMGIPVFTESKTAGDNRWTVSWNAVDEALSYELEITEQPPAPHDPATCLIMKEDFNGFYSKSNGLSDVSSKLSKYLSNSSGWAGSKLFTSPKLLRIGTSSANGYIVGPVYDVPESGEITVVIGAAPYETGTKVDFRLQFITNTGDSEESYSLDKEGRIVANLYTRDSLFRVGVFPTGRMYMNHFAIYEGTYSEEELTQVESKSRPAPSRVKGSKTFTTSDTSFTFTRLTPGSTYFCVARSVGDYAKSLWSDEISFVAEGSGLPGDINGDGSVNITDVVETINLIAAGSYSSAADLNADNAVNISDVVQIINIIAGL